MLDSPQLGPLSLVHQRTGIDMQTMRYCAVVVPEESIEVIENKDTQQVGYVAPCLHILCLLMRPLLKQYVNNKILRWARWHTLSRHSSDISPIGPSDLFLMRSICWLCAQMELETLIRVTHAGNLCHGY